MFELDGADSQTADEPQVALAPPPTLESAANPFGTDAEDDDTQGTDTELEIVHTTANALFGQRSPFDTRL